MYRALLALTLSFAVALAAPRASAQTEPGWGFTWERVGDRPVDAITLAFDDAGALWAAAADTLRRLDLAGGLPGIWRPAAYWRTGGEGVLPLGGDTLLLARSGKIYRSTDGGAFFEEVSAFAREVLYEVPPGHPYAGRLLTATQSGAAGAGYSDDRGATWTPAVDNVPAGANSAFAFAAVPAGTVPGVPGRVVAGGDGGVWLSDDGGGAWRPSAFYSYPRYQGQKVAALARPGGGVRLVVLVDDTQTPAIRTLHSDDGGATWAEGTALLEPSGDGLGWPNAEGLVALGGGSAVAVLGRGRVWRTEDGGATWAEVAQAPRLTTGTTASTAALGPDGRLYVAMLQTGATDAWVYRTAETLTPTTATTATPEGDTSLRLDAVPNPADGAVALTLSLPEPGPVRLAVYDGLGREVAVLADGPLAAGAHAFTLAAALPPGVYLARATAGATTATARLTLVR